MLTTVREMNRREHRAMCALVARLIPSLTWRHSGLGMLQGYVQEAEAADEFRVHIWDADLRRAGIERSGLLHDHRFDMTSQVLVGGIGQVEYALRPADDGPWQLHEVVNARTALATAASDGSVRPLPERYAVDTLNVEVRAGESYDFPKREFHGTYPTRALTITMVTKSNQDARYARILAPHGEPVVHAFADPLPRAAWQGTLHRAAAALLAVVS